MCDVSMPTTPSLQLQCTFDTIDKAEGSYNYTYLDNRVCVTSKRGMNFLDAVSGKLLQQIPSPEDTLHEKTHCWVSENLMFVMYFERPSSIETSVWSLDLPTSSRKQIVALRGYARRMTLNFNKTQLCVSYTSEIRMMDIMTREIVRVVQTSHDFDAWIFRETSFTGINENHQLETFDLETGKLLKSLRVYSCEILATTNDLRYVVTIDYYSDVCVWDYANEKKL